MRKRKPREKHRGIVNLAPDPRCGTTPATVVNPPGEGQGGGWSDLASIAEAASAARRAEHGGSSRNPPPPRKRLCKAYRARPSRGFPRRARGGRGAGGPRGAPRLPRFCPQGCWRHVGCARRYTRAALRDCVPQRAARRSSTAPLRLGLLDQFSTTRLPLPHDVFVRDQFDVRIVGFFQALLDLSSKPSIVLRALDIIPHEISQQLGAGPVISARSLRESLFQFLIHTECKGGFRHDLNSRTSNA